VSSAEQQPAADPARPQRRAESLRRDDFTVVRAIPTRWADVDTYGHVNNAVHYELMDTAVNGWLAEATGTDIRQLDATGWVVETSCRYFAQLHFPGTVEVGLALAHLGTSSVVYQLALFNADDLAALGRFVHVYVNRVEQRPAPVPELIRGALARLGPAPVDS
jgi:acyl-CoA thioester hydrolase